jgi:hypothetical protein
MNSAGTIRRRPTRIQCLAVLPLLCVGAALAAASGDAGVLPQAGLVVGTLRFPVRETPLFTARGGSLFVLNVPSQRAKSITVTREGRSGTLTSRRVPFALPYYLMDVSAGPDGVYAGTAVIKRFTNVPDVLVRIDPETLAVQARASFPSRVAAIEQGRSMWASIGDGRVVRLDPRTLAIEASRRLLSVAAVSMRGLSLSKPAFGLGSLWVLAGDKLGLELVRLDPMSLAVRSKTDLSVGVARAVGRVIAGSGHVYLVGAAVVGVDARGKLLGRPVAAPDLAIADIHGSGLVGLTAPNPALVLLNAHGWIVARTSVHDDSLLLTVSGDNAWFLGDAGHGNGIVHVHLNKTVN